MSALRKVLVVDDDPVVGRSFERVLSGKGYIVVTAENGQEALDKLGREQYDLVFTDIRMPGMSGLEMAEQVDARQPWVPVVIVTGYGTEENEARAEAAGVVGFVRKPLSPELIEYSARKALAAVRPNVAAQTPATLNENATAKFRLLGDAGSIAKDVSLFFISPLIGLAYVLLFPLIGIGIMAWIGVRAFVKRSRSV
jgi:CheY-like chemotaxis protein